MPVRQAAGPFLVYWRKSPCACKYTLDVGLIPPNRQGKLAIYFQCIFLQRTYVFIAKGTTAEFQADFQVEHMAHLQVKDLEPDAIPVHLGLFNFSLPIISRPYYADHKTYLYHFALLSYSGNPVSVVFLRGVAGRGYTGATRSVSSSDGHWLAET